MIANLSQLLRSQDIMKTKDILYNYRFLFQDKKEKKSQESED